MSNKLLDNENESIRREILSLLGADLDATINDGILKGELAQLGLATDTQRLREQLYWLQSQGLIKLEITGFAAIHVASLTDRGLDVAENRLRVEGIARKRLG